MKYCSHCGHELVDEAVICVNCGCAVGKKSNKIVDETGLSETQKTLYLIAFILNLISTIASAFAIIPLAWCIPMTVMSYKMYKGEKEVSTTFGVCELIFLNLISGILHLVGKSQ